MLYEADHPLPTHVKFKNVQKFSFTAPCIFNGVRWSYSVSFLIFIQQSNISSTSEACLCIKWSLPQTKDC